MFWNLLNENKYSNFSFTPSNENSREISIYNLIPLSLIPIICLFGVVTNGLNIAVFLNSKMKDPSFKYMLAISIGNFFYNGLLSYGFIIFCEECALNKSYGTQVFKILINNYVASCLAVFVSLVEIYLSIQRYFILINKRYLYNLSCRAVMFMIVSISLLYNIPVLFCYDIMSRKTFDQENIIRSDLYSTKLSEFGKSSIG